MSVNNFIPEIWSKLILAALEKQLVFEDCCNKNYQGEIKGAGSKVHIGGVGAITVSPYVKNSTEISYEDLTDSTQELTIDQCHYFAFKVDDVDKAQTNAGIITRATLNAAYAMKDVIDQFVAQFVDEAGLTLGSVGDPVLVNSSNITETILRVGRLMDDANVPQNSRWIVLPPWAVEDLILAKVVKDTNNSETLTNGTIGRYLGFNIKKSNNVYQDSGCYQILAGTQDAITLAKQIDETETIRLEKQFGDGIRGLLLYGVKVVQPNCLCCLTCDEEAEAA